jgi:uncharacterized membrane protein YeaQ/YmgE (transglycosylase-associated protein family)
MLMPHVLLYAMPVVIEEHKEIIVTIIIGAIAGYLAQFIVPGRGFGLLSTIVIGIIGSYLGNYFLGQYLHLTHYPVLDKIICATTGAMVLVIVLNLLRGKPRDGKAERDVYDWENE